MDYYKILIISLVSLYHISIINGLEKLNFNTYIPYNTSIKRPTEKCENNESLYCIGMPSGHTESITIFGLALIIMNYISLPMAVLLIISIGFERIYTKRHTSLQVLIGFLLGSLYVCVYDLFLHSELTSNVGLFSENYMTGVMFILKIMFILFIFSAILISLLIYKLDKNVYEPIPDWVDKSLIEKIKEKQNPPLYLKIISILYTCVSQSQVYLSWSKLELCLDKIIEKIKNTNVKYDAIVGIKTGGAIISDYISKKLNIKNYKIKLSKTQNNCKYKTTKNQYDALEYAMDVVLNNKREYSICEGIEDDLENQNVILIDELVNNGNTMIYANKYLLEEKKVKSVYITTIVVQSKEKVKNLDIDINYLGSDVILAWPWGWDN